MKQVKDRDYDGGHADLNRLRIMFAGGEGIDTVAPVFPDVFSPQRALFSRQGVGVWVRRMGNE
jgi:hypothetical protein